MERKEHLKSQSELAGRLFTSFLCFSQRPKALQTAISARSFAVPLNLQSRLPAFCSSGMEPPRTKSAVLEVCSVLTTVLHSVCLCLPFLYLHCLKPCFCTLSNLCLNMNLFPQIQSETKTIEGYENLHSINLMARGASDLSKKTLKKWVALVFLTKVSVAAFAEFFLCFGGIQRS